jgi:tetrapyrrole methylase family protein/MazG family protein
MPQAPTNLHLFASLVEVVKILRGPSGCPWDREQTQVSLTQYAIEEAHELVDAIEEGDTKGIIGELGDLLLQVVLHAEIARQDGCFDINDVILSINEKMVRRHPHVFGSVEVKNSTEVLANWTKIKAEEKKERFPESYQTFDLPKNLPALQKAQKIGKKSRDFNFDWDSSLDVMEKVSEEMGELNLALQENDKPHIAEELGDLLFSLSQLARHHKLDAEQCLRKANRKFEKRFFSMMAIGGCDPTAFASLPRDEKETLWNKAKEQVI